MGLRDVREEAGLGLNEAARDMGLAPASLSEWERDITSPTIPSLRRVRAFYSQKIGRRVTFDELIGEDGDATKEA